MILDQNGFFLMIRGPPGSVSDDILSPYTSPFRSFADDGFAGNRCERAHGPRRAAVGGAEQRHDQFSIGRQDSVVLRVGGDLRGGVTREAAANDRRTGQRSQDRKSTRLNSSH